MKLIYLASPYSHPDESVRESRFIAVCKATGEMMSHGLMILSPIAHTHPVAMHSALPLHFEFYAAYDELLISRCDELHVLMLDGWKESVGVTAELALAEKLNRPVRFIQYPMNPAHFCPDWDEDLIEPYSVEMDSCHCRIGS